MAFHRIFFCQLILEINFVKFLSCLYTRDFVFDIKAMSTQANFNLPVMQSKYKYMHKYHYHFQNIRIYMHVL